MKLIISKAIFTGLIFYSSLLASSNNIFDQLNGTNVSMLEFGTYRLSQHYKWMGEKIEVSLSKRIKKDGVKLAFDIFVNSKHKVVVFESYARSKKLGRELCAPIRREVLFMDQYYDFKNIVKAFYLDSSMDESVRKEFLSNAVELFDYKLFLVDDNGVFECSFSKGSKR